MDTLFETFNCQQINEITVEMNPEDVTHELLKHYQSLHINRISLGVQSFIESECKALGRRHTVKTAHKALELIKQYPFELNIDLMYGLKESSVSSVLNSLKHTHYDPNISTYCLTIKRKTRFHQKTSQRVGQMKSQSISCILNYFSSTL